MWIVLPVVRQAMISSIVSGDPALVAQVLAVASVL